MMSEGQIMSWYHSKILRIPHGKQNPTKRYLIKEQILELFDGIVVIQEKVDGKLSVFKKRVLTEDMSGKHTVHKHIMKYTKLPPDNKIHLDMVVDDKFYDVVNYERGKDSKTITYMTLTLYNPTIKEIYLLLESLSKLPSHFGNDKIEGLVVKNYKKQLMGKWINDEFEDKLPKENE